MSQLPPGSYTQVGGAIDEVAVSLRVIGDDLDPEHVSRLLGVEPSLLRRKGEVRNSSRGITATSTASLAMSA